MKKQDSETLAEEIRALGERVTSARLEVLYHLRQAKRALSHSDMEERFDRHVDRVTLYRTLDWLVEKKLAHRSMDKQRIARYSPSVGPAIEHESHAHFECDDCGKVFCLERVTPTRPRLPNGFRARDVELSVHGSCSACAGSSRP